MKFWKRLQIWEQLSSSVPVTTVSRAFHIPPKTPSDQASIDLSPAVNRKRRHDLITTSWLLFPSVESSFWEYVQWVPETRIPDDLMNLKLDIVPLCQLEYPLSSVYKPYCTYLDTPTVERITFSSQCSFHLLYSICLPIFYFLQLTVITFGAGLWFPNQS